MAPLCVTPDSPRSRRASRERGAGASRGVTLIEVLITVAIIAVISGAALGGLGAIAAARLKGDAVMVTSAVRAAYTYANASSKVVRLVFDFSARTVTIEEASSKMLLAKDDSTGGAAPATAAEQEAVAAGEQLLKGPRPPRAAFTPAQVRGFSPGKEQVGKELSSGIRFYQIETGHDEAPLTEGRAYLYFFPGGQTERASIQLFRGSSSDKPDEYNVMSVVVSPLTGKAEVARGAVRIERPRTEKDASEREDTSF